MNSDRTLTTLFYSGLVSIALFYFIISNQLPILYLWFIPLSCVLIYTLAGKHMKINIHFYFSMLVGIALVSISYLLSMLENIGIDEVSTPMPSWIQNKYVLIPILYLFFEIILFGSKRFFPKLKEKISQDPLSTRVIFVVMILLLGSVF